MRNNWNGFFDVSHIEDLEKLKQIFRDALALSDSHHVDILKGWKREEYEELSADDYIEKHISLSTHNVVIDRYEYNRHADWAEKKGEIGSSTFTTPSLYLFIYLSLDNLYNIVDKYKLPKR
jgi:hypothetical protein